MIGPTNNTDLKLVSEFNSTWADRIAYLILAGLLVDIADLFIPEGWWKIAVSIGANLLIFGGVWGELWFAKRAREADDGRVAEADARAAEANAKALEAQLALEKFRKPWELPVWKLGQYEAILAPFSGTPFLIHTVDENDQRQMAATLWQAFAWAKWKRPVLAVAIVPPWIDGIDVRVNHSRVTEWRPAAEAVAKVFALSEIEATISETDGVQPDAIHVFIGRKA
jgi:hypothetical protein